MTGSHGPRDRGVGSPVLSFRIAVMCATTTGLLVGCGHSVQEQFTYAGKAMLEKDSEVLLSRGSGPAVTSVQGIVPRGNDEILLVEWTRFEVHRYGMNGEYLGMLGRHGRGVGEYRQPMASGISVAPSGATYVYDGYGTIEVFEPSGEPAGEVDIGYTSFLRIHPTGDLLQVAPSEEGAIFRRWSPDGGTEKYSVRLSGRETNHIVIHLRMRCGFAYNGADRAYFAVASDFRVKEVDVRQGRVIREFGVPPAGFQALPPELQGLGQLESPEEMDPVFRSTTLLSGMQLFKGRFLLVGHQNPGDDSSAWHLYDTESEVGAYYTVEGLEGWGRIAGMRRDEIMRYSLPEHGTQSELNGMIEFYSLRLKPEESATVSPPVPGWGQPEL